MENSQDLLDIVPALTKPLKGILKNLEQQNNTTTYDYLQARNVALGHARILEERKQRTADVFEAVFKLIELPSSPEPSQDEIALFKSLVRTFQPADFDTLVEERNFEFKCGYPLCGNKPRKFSGKSEFTIYKNQMFSKKELQKWCSDECTKRAVYIKVQLSEIAAWERTGLSCNQIELQEERSSHQRSASIIEKEEIQARATKARNQLLEVERGPSFRAIAQDPLNTIIKENVVMDEPKAPTLSGDHEHEQTHGSIEGYTPKPLKNKADIGIQ